MTDNKTKDPVAAAKALAPEIAAARAYVLGSVGSMWEGFCRGINDPGPLVLQARLAITHAIRESIRAVDLLYYAAGQHVAGLHFNFEYAARRC